MVEAQGKSKMLQEGNVKSLVHYTLHWEQIQPMKYNWKWIETAHYKLERYQITRNLALNIGKSYGTK